MRMSFGMHFQMSQRLALLCSVCKQEIDEDARVETKVTVELFGAVKYAVCPCCQQEVQDHSNQSYRRRFRKWLKEHQ